MSGRAKSNSDDHGKVKRIFLVGSPNVGKSSVFNALTGSYVVVSNYPGTTVDIATGTMTITPHHQFSVVDTPGLYSLSPITAEEDVTLTLLLTEKPDCILHIVDAKNLERMLPLTLQLMEAGLPVILVLNVYDELLACGMNLAIAHLEHDLGIPVVNTVAVKGIGVDNLSARIVEVVEGRHNFTAPTLPYPPAMEAAITAIVDCLQQDYSISKRSMAMLILQGDSRVLDMVKEEAGFNRINELRNPIAPREAFNRFSTVRQERAREIVAERLILNEQERKGAWKETLSQIMIHPVWGMPILALVLWFGLYKFVGQFGAGTLVGFIEKNIFEDIVNPRVDVFFHTLFGTHVLFNLFAGDYGIITLGVRYAIALIFPIVGCFFIAFSIIEDSGYLPRLAMLGDALFKKIGLSGRAVIPLTLGFGCDTMATIVTRTLESRKERIIATFLLSLAIPCAAQLGVLLGLMAGNLKMLLIWTTIMIGVFLAAGFCAKRLVKGDDPGFFIELPPLRLPTFINVFTKTYTRMVWYFKEVIPLFILASVLIWLGNLTGALKFLVGLMNYPVSWVGLPAGASPAFLYGFFRRDFGAAGLFDLARTGVLHGNSLLVAAIVLTLFVPCVAQFAVMWKERGRSMAIGMACFIFPFAFLVGFIVNFALNTLGINL